MNIVRNRSISLTFRGFEDEPEVVEEVLGVKASRIGRQGSPPNAGGSSLKRSFVLYELEFSDTPPLCEMVPAILAHLGGIEKLALAHARIRPERLEFNIVLPIKQSPEQEGGFVTTATIADLHRIGATLSFEFLDGPAPRQT